MYGKLRRFASSLDPRSESVISIQWREGDNVARVIERVGVPLEELGSNLFINGGYADLASPVCDGDRVGLFPSDMQLLYKWYFRPKR